MSRRADTEPTDGRVARSHRSRRAIVDAMRALHAEGDLRPTAPRVAERAGVSVRTVWQQFADMETLLVEADRRDNEILRSLAAADRPRPAADRAGRDVHPAARPDPGADDARAGGRPASTSRSRPSSPATRRRRWPRPRPSSRPFSPRSWGNCAGKKRQQLLDGLHAISIWSFWESLRTELLLGPEQAEELFRATFTGLLGAAGFA